MMRKPFITEAEMNAALQTLHAFGALGQAAWALRFRNSMRSFLDYWEPTSPAEVVRVLCVDTTEIVAHYSYHARDFRAFTFGGLLTSSSPEASLPTVKAELNTL